MIADPFRKTCITSVNYFGKALGWGDHCIMRTGRDKNEFGSHATEFGTGIFPNIAGTKVFFKFPCVAKSKPNLEEFFFVDLSTGVPVETDLTAGSAFMADPVDALACSDIISGTDPATAVNGTIELSCKLGFFYLYHPGLVSATHAGKAFRFKLTDAQTYTLAD